MNNNNTEIERKFLVESIPFGLDAFKCHNIEQGYISTDPTIRIRKKDSEYILTVKGAGLIERKEYELDLTKEQFEKLLKKVESSIIKKKRYLIPLSGELTAELDIYDGYLSGFMNVEVEFHSLKEALLFEPPAWFSRELTEDKRYTNGSLAYNGLPKEEK